jgi:hypothetical protein
MAPSFAAGIAYHIGALPAWFPSSVPWIAIPMPYSKYLPGHMGSIKLLSAGPFEAGSCAELVLVYTAGTFGIDDTGMVKVSWRTTSDLSRPQFDKAQAPNFTTVEASNGAKLEVWFDRLNIRPYANTLLIRVGRGYLRAGDTLTTGSVTAGKGRRVCGCRPMWKRTSSFVLRSMPLRPTSSASSGSSRHSIW